MVPFNQPPVSPRGDSGRLIKGNSVQALPLFEQIEGPENGIGFFKPNFYENPSLYFYGNVNLEKGLTEHLPMDSVENSGKVRLKPFEQAGEIAIEYEFIQPLIVNEEWLYGKFVDGQLKEKGKGWIRWRKGNKLYINYSLFS